MRYLALILLSIFPMFAQDQAKPKQPDWEPLKFLVGHWKGNVQGEPGAGKVERSYEFGVGGTFLIGNNRSVYPPQKANPKGETHVDHTVISYDKARRKYVMRQFHVEGFVNQYVLEEISPNGKKLVWVTEAIENIPPGWRARETYLIKGLNEFTEKFELAEPGKDFETYSQSEFTRN